MPAGTMYLCESGGARILALGAGITQVGTNFQVSLQTWDLTPAGEAGECYFRSLEVTIEFDNGFNIGVIPVVDGVDQPEQFFTGSGTGTEPLQATVLKRGTRISAKVRTVSRTGTVSVLNVQAHALPIRTSP